MSRARAAYGSLVVVLLIMTITARNAAPAFARSDYSVRTVFNTSRHVLNTAGFVTVYLQFQRHASSYLPEHDVIALDGDGGQSPPLSWLVTGLIIAGIAVWIFLRFFAFSKVVRTDR